jgi:hypothetical protein
VRRSGRNRSCRAVDGTERIAQLVRDRTHSFRRARPQRFGAAVSGTNTRRASRLSKTASVVARGVLGRGTSPSGCYDSGEEGISQGGWRDVRHRRPGQRGCDDDIRCAREGLAQLAPFEGCDLRGDGCRAQGASQDEARDHHRAPDHMQLGCHAAGPRRAATWSTWQGPLLQRATPGDATHHDEVGL